MSKQPIRDYKTYAARTADGLARLRDRWMARGSGAAVSEMSAAAGEAALCAETFSRLMPNVLSGDPEVRALIGITCMLPLVFLDAGSMDHIDAMIRDWQRFAEGKALGPDKTYSYDELRAMLGLGQTQAKKYIRSAGVALPERGDRKHRFTHAEVVRVLKQASETGGTKHVKKTAIDNLLRLSETTI